MLWKYVPKSSPVKRSMVEGATVSQNKAQPLAAPSTALTRGPPPPLRGRGMGAHPNIMCRTHPSIAIPKNRISPACQLERNRRSAMAGVGAFSRRNCQAKCRQ